MTKAEELVTTAENLISQLQLALDAAKKVNESLVTGTLDMNEFGQMSVRIAYSNQMIDRFQKTYRSQFIEA